MKRQVQTGGQISAKTMYSRSFFCCCPIVLPLLRFFALRWAVLKAAGKL